MLRLTTSHNPDEVNQASAKHGSAHFVIDICYSRPLNGLNTHIYLENWKTCTLDFHFPFVISCEYNLLPKQIQANCRINIDKIQ